MDTKEPDHSDLSLWDYSFRSGYVAMTWKDEMLIPVTPVAHEYKDCVRAVEIVMNRPWGELYTIVSIFSVFGNVPQPITEFNPDGG